MILISKYRSQVPIHKALKKKSGTKSKSFKSAWITKENNNSSDNFDYYIITLLKNNTQ